MFWQNIIQPYQISQIYVTMGFFLLVKLTGLNLSPQGLDVRFITIEGNIKLIIISCKSCFKCGFISRMNKNVTSTIHTVHD